MTFLPFTLTALLLHPTHYPPTHSTEPSSLPQFTPARYMLASSIVAAVAALVFVVVVNWAAARERVGDFVAEMVEDGVLPFVGKSRSAEAEGWNGKGKGKGLSWWGGRGGGSGVGADTGGKRDRYQRLVDDGVESEDEGGRGTGLPF